MVDRNPAPRPCREASSDASHLTTGTTSKQLQLVKVTHFQEAAHQAHHESCSPHIATSLKIQSSPKETWTLRPPGGLPRRGELTTDLRKVAQTPGWGATALVKPSGPVKHSTLLLQSRAGSGPPSREASRLRASLTCPSPALGVKAATALGVNAGLSNLPGQTLMGP